MTFEFFHNSCLIRQIQQNKIYKKFRDLPRNWTQIACLTVRYLNHYTKLFSVLVWGYNWILFMLGWFCPIRLIHLIGRKSLHFEKKLEWHLWQTLITSFDSVTNLWQSFVNHCGWAEIPCRGHAICSDSICSYCTLLAGTIQFYCKLNSNLCNIFFLSGISSLHIYSHLHITWNKLYKSTV